MLWNSAFMLDVLNALATAFLRSSSTWRWDLGAVAQTSDAMHAGHAARAVGGMPRAPSQAARQRRHQYGHGA